MNRVGTLDGLRGIAILFVLAGHSVSNFQPMSGDARTWGIAFANSGVGVRLFFVLSGYLITWLLLREHESTGRISVPQFYLRRAFRILPAFYVFLAGLAVLSQWKTLGITTPAWIAAGTFTWNYAAFWIPPQPGEWYVGHLWTLAIEQQFYLFWPLVLAFLGPRRALYAAAGLMIWCPIARVGTYFLFPEQRGLVGMMLHTGIDSLMTGCAAALLLADEGRARFLASRGAVGAAVGSAWLLVGSPLVSTLVRGSSVSVVFTCDAIAAAWIIAWAHHSPSAWVNAMLGRGILPKLGVVSYSLYLWQQVFLSPHGALSRGHVLLPLAGAIVMAAASLIFVERPALALAHRLRPKSRPVPALEGVP